jgi:exopolyphosphatase / guanosine-5'-triphosphate,3'-diphosphate pyrophosphatase
MPVKKIASIDIGTNTIRMAVWEKDAAGNFREIHANRAIVRLGEGMSSNNRLLDHRMEKAIDVLSGYKEECEEIGGVKICAVATSAVREAENKNEFVERVKSEIGMEINVIPWEEEARLTLTGVFWRLPAGDSTTLSFDIGGGSTEFILSKGNQLIQTIGSKLGVVRLTERFLTQHPIDNSEYDLLVGFLREEIEKINDNFSKPKISRIIGTAGTVTTLAAIKNNVVPYDPEKIHGITLKLDEIREIQETLKKMTLAERLELPALERGREDLIVSGTAIVIQVMEIFEIEDLTVCEYGLREGTILDNFLKLENP